MSFLYPGNQDRANRVQQLATNIGSIQSEANDSLVRVDTQVDHQLDEVNNIMKLAGIKTVDDLNNKIQAMMTPEQRAAYMEQVKYIQGQNAVTDKILQASGIVAFVAGTVRLSAAPIARILSTGALAAGADLFGRGFVALLNGEEVGLRMMQAAYRTFRALRIGGTVSTTATRVARLVRTAAAVLTVLSVALDGVLLIYQAVEGAKQRDELQEAIRELVARRFQVKELEDQLFATEAYCAQVSAFLVTYRVLKEQGQPEAAVQAVMEALLSNVVSKLTQDLDAITEDKVWNQLAALDKQTSNAWTNEDPSHEWVQAFIQSQKPVVPDSEANTIAASMLKRIESHTAGEKGDLHTE